MCEGVTRYSTVVAAARAGYRLPFRWERQGSFLLGGWSEGLQDDDRPQGRTWIEVEAYDVGVRIELRLYAGRYEDHPLSTRTLPYPI